MKWLRPRQVNRYIFSDDLSMFRLQEFTLGRLLHGYLEIWRTNDVRSLGLTSCLNMSERDVQK